MGRKSRAKKLRKQASKITLFEYAYIHYLKLGRGLVSGDMKTERFEYLKIEELNNPVQELIDMLLEYDPENELVLCANFSWTPHGKKDVIVVPKTEQLAQSRIFNVSSISVNQEKGVS